MGMFDIPAFKQARRERTQAELEAESRALLGLPQPEKQADVGAESEDHRMLMETIEAQKHAHDPVSEQEQFESGAKIFGEKTMRDWETFHDQ
jgi:hypothetical protein